MNKLLKICALCLIISGCFEEKFNTFFKTPDGEIKYNLEVALKPEEQSRGLMERDSIAEKGGMLFPIEPVQPVTMWMRNTKMPLDIIFIDNTNRIVKIIENAKPMSIEYLNSEYPVRAVIEINGGHTRKHNIQVGQYIQNTDLDAFKAKIKAQRDAAAIKKETTTPTAKTEDEKKSNITNEPKENTEKEIKEETQAETTSETETKSESSSSDTNSSK